MLWRSTVPKRLPPGFIEPCIPTRVDKPPVGPQWVHEVKHDGYRLIVRRKDDRVRLFTRRGYDWTDRYPLIRKAVAALRTASAVVDGEAAWCDDAGFDLLELDGEDWRPRPLEERKARLEKLLAKAPAGIQYSEHLEGDGAAIFALACGLGAEGIVSKHRERAYAPPTAQPTEVTLALREKGWVPYRVWFEPEEELWVAKVIDWGQAA
jgi:bifunctional non-homologous end joining protein LigD